MALLDWHTLIERANRDGEFRLHARFWNARLRIGIGDVQTRLEIRDGALTGAMPWLGSMAGNLSVSAPEVEWEALLERVPRPFYQDLHPATIHHGFRVSGDTRNYCAYYPAIRRLIELMRDVRHAAV